MAIHYKTLGRDFRNAGQSNYEYSHQTMCGFVRDDLTKNPVKVTCKLCLRKLSKGGE